MIWNPGQTDTADVFRVATPEDIEFVGNLAMEGAIKGNYSDALLRPEMFAAFQQTLKQIVDEGVWVKQSDKSSETLLAKIYIYQSGYHNSRKAFVFVTEKAQGAGDRAVEISMISVRPDDRDKGFGSRMMSILQTMCPVGGTISARCYPDSAVMLRILRRSGFAETGRVFGEAAEYCYRKTSTNIAGLHPSVSIVSTRRLPMPY